jgi:CRISPR/Cas system CSM-associated protein Csm3 (group 7 of RAMP superfamily)
MDSKLLNYRYMARVEIEADTPLSIGAGQKGETIDRLVEKDFYGLPFIPATALAGVLRHGLEAINAGNGLTDSIFGYHEKNHGQGSRILFTDGCLLGKNNLVVEGICEPENILGNEYYFALLNLPKRHHTRIGHAGAADGEGMGKFDEEVVYKGTRFVFEMELIGSEEDKAPWELLISSLQSPFFRLGGGTRKGFGKIKITDLKQRVLMLNGSDLDAYLTKPSALNGQNMKFWSEKNEINDSMVSSEITFYQLQLTPEDFFIFGSGEGRDDWDAVPVIEDVVEWKENGPVILKDQLLIPASSVKGAIAHRTAFHFNQLNEIFADDLSQNEIAKHTGEYNTAVKILFGNAKEAAFRGALLFSDVLKGYNKENQSKVFNHVKIDRLTGGAFTGALFDEQVVADPEGFSFEIILDKTQLKNNLKQIKTDGSEIIEKKAIEAFECALEDICNGLLPLGGSVMKGHGRFNGKMIKHESDKIK